MNLERRDPKIMTDGHLMGGHFGIHRTAHPQPLFSWLKMERASYYQRYQVITCFLGLQYTQPDDFLGTGSNSRHINGSMLGRRELLAIERSARQSMCYSRNSMRKIVSSWTKRQAQRLLFGSEFVPHPVISLSRRNQGLTHAPSSYTRKQPISDAPQI